MFLEEKEWARQAMIEELRSKIAGDWPCSAAPRSIPIEHRPQAHAGFSVD